MRLWGTVNADHNFCCVKALELLELKLSLLSSYRFRKKTSSPPSEAGIISVRPLCFELLCHQSLELVGLLRRFAVLSVEFFFGEKRIKLAFDATPRRGTRRRTRSRFKFVKFYSF
jgi:hypothetical protein